jgi:hypothetical protein
MKFIDVSVNIMLPSSEPKINQKAADGSADGELVLAFCEASLNFYQTPLRHMPEDSNSHFQVVRGVPDVGFLRGSSTFCIL